MSFAVTSARHFWHDAVMAVDWRGGSSTHHMRSDKNIRKPSSVLDASSRTRPIGDTIIYVSHLRHRKRLLAYTNEQTLQFTPLDWVQFSSHPRLLRRNSGDVPELGML